jgi:hypothetical protein
MMEDKIGFNLVAITTEQFAKFENNFAENQDINIKTSVNYKLNQSKKQIGAYVKFTFEQKKKAFLTIEVGGHFLIDPKSWESFCKDDKIIFPKDFIGHLSMITIGTTRGVLHEKTMNTDFNKFVIPLIDVTKLVQEDIQFTKNQ